MMYFVGINVSTSTKFLLSNFSDADTMTIQIENGKYSIVVVSSYFASDRAYHQKF